MDIYSAESHVKKLLQYVQDLKDENPNMYEKSRMRLKSVAISCSEVIHVISEILQEGALESDSDEFEVKSDGGEILQVADSIKAESETLRSFVSTSSTPEPTELTRAVRKTTVAAYAQNLKNLASAPIPYSTVRDCASILWTWYETRFLQKDESFHYNIRRFPDWVRDIVIMYGKRVEEGNPGSFVKEVHDWCASLSTSHVVHAVPYSVFQFDKTHDASMLTLTAAVIWDVLLDYGLHDLCAKDDLHLKEDSVYSLCGRLNPESLNFYVNYKDDASVLERCWLV